MIKRDLFLGAKYPDMIISCGGHEFNVHRAIICPQSSFFEAAVNGNFSEAQSMKIILPEDDPETIERVLSFLYTQEYKEVGHTMDLGLESASAEKRRVSDDYSDGVDDQALQSVYNNIRVYVAADKFDITPLKNMAIRRVMDWVEKNYKHERFPDVVRRVLESVAAQGNLRQVLIDYISLHSATMAEWKDMVRVMEDFGDLACAVLNGVMDDLRSLQKKVDKLNEAIECSDYGVLRKEINEKQKCKNCSGLA
ncbi:BTB/POZ protein [Thermoascus aurantiacus ATCC 26904]